MNLNNLVQAAIFAAVSIGLGFMFMMIPNVEFISVTVFLAGLTLGGIMGILVGSTTMLIYSTMNPLGSGLIYFPLLIGQIIAMAGVGMMGSIMAGLLRTSLPFTKIMIGLAGLCGLIASILYDSITTFVYPISAGYSWKETVAYTISGLLFTTMHLVSNIAIFGIVVPQYLRKLNQ
jgi:hypothetical protein